ncbi:PilW family protein [Vibrio gallaecicus]|uniref:PilW family protein n=1 Tax=Vibrio gallaecicus TaxID=552386 RepID=UPI0010C9FFFF|nr:prepilin-type N-terminal cleavage/methylation domain-containing protein [Vibrio gallaecicus]MDN3614261.1 prepilin-type N-terminal cleavage/methylation domain-containing protein [Vibrio gallaecicus]
MKFANSCSSQRGATLVEMMIASFLGLIAIAIIGSAFLSTQRVVTNNSLELLIQHNLFSMSQIMKDEMLRAGYSGDIGRSVKLSGATHTIHIDNSGSDAAMAFVYLNSQSGQPIEYLNILYGKSGDEIDYCEVKSSDVMLLSAMLTRTPPSGVAMSCESVFFKKQISVSDFSLTSKEVKASGVNTQVIDFNIDATLVNTGINYSVNSSVKQRNL